MHRDTFKAIISAVYLFSSCLYAVESVNNNLLAVGSYASFSRTFTPWIVTSNNQGITWSYFSKVPLELSLGRLYQVKCNNDLCVTVGTQFSADDEKASPIVAISKDKDKKIWSTVSLNPADFVSGADTNSVDCTTQFCAVTSGYYNKDNRHVPYIAITKDKGLTWTYPDMITNLPNDFESLEMFGSISCSNSICAVPGYYLNKEKTYRILIAVSTDQGTTWSYRTTPLPDDFARFSADYSQIHAQCGDTFCLAGGSYEDPYGPQGLILKSADKGVSWSYEKLPDNITYPVENIICRDKTCIAVGLADIGSTFAKNKKLDDIPPVMAISRDAGQSWSYPKVKNIPLDFQAQFKSVAMGENNYIAGGYARSELVDLKPSLAISKDKGMTWSYVAAIKPFGFFAGVITDVSCFKNICMATGAYVNFNNRIFPYLIMSYDDGETWLFPSTIISQLPINFFSLGIFNASYSRSMQQQQAKVDYMGDVRKNLLTNLSYISGSRIAAR